LYIDLVPKGKEKKSRGGFPELQKTEKPKKVKGNYPVP